LGREQRGFKPSVSPRFISGRAISNREFANAPKRHPNNPVNGRIETEVPRERLPLMRGTSIRQLAPWKLPILFEL